MKLLSFADVTLVTANGVVALVAPKGVAD